MALLVCLANCALDDGRPLRVATNLWPGYEPLYLAQFLGAYEDRVEVIQLPSATEVMRAMSHGSVDSAALTLDEAITLMSRGVDIVVLLALDYSRGGDAILSFQPHTDITALKGMSVGVERSALGAIVLSEALHQAGLGYHDISLVDMSPDEHEAALTNNRVDAVVTFEPVKSKLISHGASVLFDTRQAPDLVVDVLVVRRFVLESRPQQMQALVSGYLRARDYMKTHQSEAQGFFCKRLQLEPEQLQQALSGLYLPTLQDNIRWLSGSPSAFQNAFERTLRIMQTRDLVQGNPAPLLRQPVWLLEASD